MRFTCLFLLAFLATVATSRANTVDVTTLYTTATRNYLGGTAGVKAHQALIFATANQAFASSGVGIRLRPRGLQKVRHRETSNPASSLRQMRKRRGGFRSLDEWQSRYKSDLVCLLVATNSSSIAGIAYLPFFPKKRSFIDTNSDLNSLSVVSVINAGVDTFAHEVAHNFGCSHGVNDTPSDTVQENRRFGLATYAFGHEFIVPGMFVDELYGTVMSYDGFPSMLFSNPNVLYDGTIPVGVAGQADNAAWLNVTRKVVSKYSTQHRRRRR